MAKIIDFGESLFLYNENEDKAKEKNYEKKKNHRPGRTLPFAPPEIFTDKIDKIDYHFKIDVFSFGICASDLFFDEYLVEFRRNNLQSLQMKYNKGNYKARLHKEIVKMKGPKHLMTFLMILILKCIEFQQESRASIEWIIIILRDSLGLLEKMF